MADLFAAFGIDGKMLVVQIVNFTILLGALWYFLYRPLLAFLDQRRDETIQSVENARKAERHLVHAEEERAKKLTEATKEAAEIIDTAKKSATAKHDGIITEAMAKASRLIDEASAEAEELKRKSMHESKEEIARMIVSGVEKTLREKART